MTTAPHRRAGVSVSVAPSEARCFFFHGLKIAHGGSFAKTHPTQALRRVYRFGGIFLLRMGGLDQIHEQMLLGHVFQKTRPAKEGFHSGRVFQRDVREVRNSPGSKFGPDGV